jgi:hypothetical protein
MRRSRAFLMAQVHQEFARIAHHTSHANRSRTPLPFSRFKRLNLEKGVKIENQ